MSKFWIVFNYEFKRQVTNKVFLIITLFLIIAASVGGFFISKPLNGLSELLNPPIVPEENEVIDAIPLTVYAPENLKSYIHQLDVFGYDIDFVENQEAVSKNIIDTDSIGIIVKDYNDVEKIVSDTRLMIDSSHIDHALNTLYQRKLLHDSGLSEEEISSIMNSQVTINMNNTGVDGIVGYGYVYTYTMFLYMATLMFGGVISSSVITEKTSKAMELLITSAKPSSLIAGKVIAIGVSCLLQMGLVLTTLFISLKLFTTNVSFNQLLEMIGGIPWDILSLALILFIFGFFSILFLFAAFSSFATKPEDANTVISPLIIIILIVFMVNISSMGSNLLNTPMFKVLSYFPVLSPFLLFSRYALYGLSSFEILFGIACNILGAFLLIWMAAKIYRSGTLYYGNKIKLSKILNVFKK